MSAVATAENVTTVDAPHLHAVETGPSAEYKMHAAEMNRWMVYFGVPVLIAAFFVGMVFATGDAWWMGLAISAIVCDILVLVWLAMSSDTNGLIGDSPVH
jgi:uncharacterized membrane protein